jgi:tetratricopeptide (TPR) repeat protein
VDIRRSFCRRISLFILAIVFLMPLESLNGMYRAPDLLDVPVDRLIRNLEATAKNEPANFEVRYNLARAHAMAFALKPDTAQVWKGRESEGVWFGYEPKAVPFDIQQTNDPARIEAANQHLKMALERYKEVIEMAPEKLEGALGYAWCIDQSGKKQEAIALYRKLIAEAWEREKDRSHAPLGWHSITAEAAGYLIPLLDKDTDQAEVKTLQDRIEQMGRVPRPITPIVIPLKKDLTISDLEDVSASVRFDADGTGLRKRWTWITEDAGWLVWDPRGSGKIDSSLQLFGNVTFWLFWENGYQALAALDDNHDGLLNGSELDGFAIWQDKNRNGISDPGEVSKLSQLGVVALSLDYQRATSHPEHLAFSSRGVFFSDGSTRSTYDLVLHPAVSSID